MSEYITNKIEICSSDREDSDEENFDKENSDKENFDEENQVQNMFSFYFLMSQIKKGIIFKAF